MKTNNKSFNGQSTAEKTKTVNSKNDQSEIVNKLNDLVEINNDRIEGYHKAEKDIRDNDLKSLFREMAGRSQTFKRELADKIKSLGGVPTDSTKTSGKIFRAWMDVKAALTNKDRKAILNACETGEDAAIEAYEEVLNAENTLTSELRNVVEKQEREINRDHEKIKELRDYEENK